MPQKRSSPPIGRMTWGRAVPVLIICAVFDLVRAFFEFFWLLGPALGAVACTVAGSNTAIGSAVGTLAVGTACTTVAGIAGFFGVEVIGPFGIIMAMATGLAGWGTVTLILAITNPGIWKSNIWGWIWSIFALGVSEVPFLGTIPMLTITHWRLYVAQINHDKAALKQYKKEQAQVAVAASAIQERRVLAQMQSKATSENEEISEEVLEAA